MNIKEQIGVLNNPFKLPCGYEVSNRIAKAAMTEHLADSTGLPNERHFTLYKRWAKSGASFLLTGNVMVDKGSLEGIGNVVLDYDQPTQRFKIWADTVKENGGQLWMQIGHAGGLSISENSLSPSGIQHIGRVRTFPKPNPMTQKDIKDVIQRFVHAASVAKECGFAGIEIHSAHQFLLNQFLSPLTNTRTDEWGGSLKNRMRLLLEIVKAVRKAVGTGYPIAVKLNSSDGFNHSGGWTEDESVQVCSALEKGGVDFLEISGGSYEATPMLGPQDIENFAERREAFFLEYAKNVRTLAPSIPIMLTAGMRSAEVMADIIESGIVQVIGMGRPLAGMPDAPKKLLSGELDSIPRFYGESLPVMEQLRWFQKQMELMANGHEPELNMTQDLIDVEKTKWNEVYTRNPEELPWFGLDIPVEVEDFLQQLNKGDLMVITGCGVGDTVKIVHTKGFKNVIGTDISSVAIEKAQKRFPGITFKVASTQEVGSKENIHDVNVFDWLNLHQISTDRLDTYLAGLTSIAKNLCLVWIYDSNEVESNKSYTHEGNIYYHNPVIVKKELKKKGLSIKKEFTFMFSTFFNNVRREHVAVGQIYAKQ